jgi:hypothetical protein
MKIWRNERLQAIFRKDCHQWLFGRLNVHLESIETPGRHDLRTIAQGAVFKTSRT